MSKQPNSNPNSNEKTLLEFDAAFEQCRELFLKKTHDYGTAWRILRPKSLTDQIFIKAKRIRTIEELGSKKINDSIESEFIGIINYCVMALIQVEMQASDKDIVNFNTFLQTMSTADTMSLYDLHAESCKDLMLLKNHDYGEAWRSMRISSFTDLILMKLLRIKQIEDNKGKTMVSEGIPANYQDIVNYAVFALIKL